MTLREFGASIVDEWNSYITEITTHHVLDWSIGHLILTFVGGFFAIVVGFMIIGSIFAFIWVWITGIFKGNRLKAAMERLEERVGAFWAGTIYMVVNLAILFIIFALLSLFSLFG